MEQKPDQREPEISMEEKNPAAINSRFKRICVFGGKISGNKDCYRVAAIELAQEFVARKLDLSYGGGSFGLMGLVAQEVHRGGQRVLGIIPKPLMNKEIIGETIGEVVLVDHMHQRKTEMAKDADCFIALPGGYGTLEMLMEVITWSQLGIHDKPVGLLNVDGYYNSLLTFFGKAVEEGFVFPSQLSIVVSASNARELVRKLEDYVPVHKGVIDKSKWEADRKAETSSKNDGDDDQIQIAG